MPLFICDVQFNPDKPIWFIDDKKIFVMHGTNMLQEVSMSFIENMDSNIVLFEGMSEKSLYLVYLTKNQVFRTVDRENVLSAWS